MKSKVIEEKITAQIMRMIKTAVLCFAEGHAAGVSFGNGEGPDPIPQGFTIQNGH